MRLKTKAHSIDWQFLTPSFVLRRSFNRANERINHHIFGFSRCCCSYCCCSLCCCCCAPHFVLFEINWFAIIEIECVLNDVINIKRARQMNGAKWNSTREWEMGCGSNEWDEVSFHLYITFNAWGEQSNVSLFHFFSLSLSFFGSIFYVCLSFNALITSHRDSCAFWVHISRDTYICVCST